MGDRFRDKTVSAYTRIVKDYPLSPRVEEAKAKLQSMEAPVPEPDPVAFARMKYEIENRTKSGMMGHLWGMFRHGPDVSAAAKSGSPSMESYQPSIPASVPQPAPVSTGVTGGTADVSVSTVTDSTALDSKPDARQNPPKPGSEGQAQPAQGQAAPAPAQGQAQPAAPGQAQGQPAVAPRGHGGSGPGCGERRESLADEPACGQAEKAQEGKGQVAPYRR